MRLLTGFAVRSRVLPLISSTFLVGLLMMAGQAQAKNMDSRLGIGFRDAFPFQLPAIAMQYYPNSGFGVTGALGIDTQENDSKFGLQLGVRKRIFEEEQLNFYMGGSFSLLTRELGTTKNSGYELAATVATEFFLTGLENLGFNLETGVAVSNLDKVRFRTLGDSFLRAGVIFYF